MQSVRLSIEYTAETIHPMHEFVCESPAVKRQYLLEGRLDDGTRTMLFHVVGEPGPYEAAMTGRERVEEYRIHEEGEGFFLFVRAPNDTAGKMMLDAVDKETVVVVPPVEFKADGTMQLTAVGYGEHLQDVVAEVPDELGVDVLAVGPYDGIHGQSPTDRQREALAAAWSAGYYDVPRQSGIEDVAEELECATSTVSTLLRRAERALVAALLDEHP